MLFKIGKLLEAFGVSADDADESETRITLGPGVITLTSMVAATALVAIAACAYALAALPFIFLAAVGVIALVILVFLIGTWIFAHRHPDLAVMGGSTLLQYHRMQMAALHPEIMVDKTLTIAPKQESDSEGGGV